MFDEIEKFLRQAAESAQQEQAKRAAEQNRRAGKQQQQRPAQRPPPPRRLTPDVEIVEAELAEDGPSRLSRDFRSSSDIADHARQLGAEVGLADEHLDEHLHRTFDHQVGTLKSRGGESATDKAATVAVTASSDVVRSVLQMLASRDGIRSAMILGEILRRPEERWQ